MREWDPRDSVRAQRALRHAEGEVDHALELERAHEVEVEDAAGVTQADGAAALLEAAQDLEAGAHDGVLAEHAEVVARGGDHLGADGVGVGAVGAARRQLRDLGLHGGDGGAAGGGGVAPAGRCALEVGHDGHAGAAPEDDGLEQRVAAEPVGAVDAHAGALAGGVEPGQPGASVDVRVDAAHGVVLHRLDRDGLLDGVDAFEVDGDVADARQALQDLLGAQVPQVEVHVVLAADAAALVDLGGDGPRGDVARRQLHRLGRVPGHEALALAVDQVAAFTAAGLGHEDVGGEQPRGVELDELHVLHRHAGVVGDGRAAAGADDGVGGVGVDAAGAARGHDHGVGRERLEPAADHVVGDDAAAAALVDDQRGDEHLDVHLDPALVGALDQRVQQVVAGLVGAVAGARVPGAAERPLGDAPVVEAAERAAPVVHLEDDAGGVPGHLDGGVLVGQVVAALDRVERVLLGRVVVGVGVVGERRVDAALRGARVAAAGVDLADGSPRRCRPRLASTAARSPASPPPTTMS